ncbi:Protein CBG20801 [Caenorhabditis briggsae]|uniref:histone acetyltransferase n=1 Tax=Caenorhabditis briggsae TaxID=6238 RepID=A8XYN2_CAEBR|nr:Protein CBG20801 [Caenorhabditis briggsae]CAP37748.1 Protein CBG20801 [Caenorhabditis briggsae]
MFNVSQKVYHCKRSKTSRSVHAKLRPFKCEICSMDFQYRSCLREHQTIHTDSWSHTCPVCEKSFRWKKYLHVHMRIHEDSKTNRQTFKCPFCVKCYSWKHILRAHLKTHFPIKEKYEEIWRKFKNGEWNKKEANAFPKNETSDVDEFDEESQKENVLLNIPHETKSTQSQSRSSRQPLKSIKNVDIRRSVRLGLKNIEVLVGEDNPQEDVVFAKKEPSEKLRFECDICSKTFGRKDSLRRHKMIHDGLVRVQCPYCVSSYNWIRSLWKHMESHFDSKTNFDDAWKRYMTGEKLVKPDRSDRSVRYNFEKNKSSSPEVYLDVQKPIRKRSINEIHETVPTPAKKARKDIPEPKVASGPVCCDHQDLQFLTSNGFCSGDRSCRIAAGAKFMCAKSKSLTYDIFCMKCFANKFPDHLNKKNFKETTNVNKKSEDVINCMNCGDAWHRICALHLKKDQFLCVKCGGGASVRKTVDMEKEYCRSSKYMSQKANQFLEKEIGEDGARRNPISVVTFTSDKNVATREMAPDLYTGDFREKYTGTIQFRTRSIYVFQKIDDVDVLFFVMHTQEYKKHADELSWFTIDYLDTVPFFQPSHLKGFMAGELILIYAEYMKSIGFQKGYLWANPPKSGDDFIFNIHPQDQKYLNRTRLEKWYRKVFQKGKEDGILNGFHAFKEEFKNRKFQKPTDLPFFHNSLWSRTMKDINLQLAETRQLNHPSFMRELEFEFKDHLTDNFFLDLANHDETSPTSDDVRTKPHKILGDREAFLIHCAKKNWEFSSLRRAKFASVAIINGLIK